MKRQNHYPVRNSKENWLSSEIILSNLLLRIRPSLKTLPELGLSKGSKSCPLRSSQIFFAMEDGILH
ncbi:hypothetical protein FG051_00400 [Companilactobacillus futsaii]|uniref:Uncharacterized protein n=1 Tax=Companilactobacillus futsaii TaxID=938155 RepID=A0A5B7T662_9LACO|nr:hypothetical protein FG051_00400 [Companilactobacillus futsaii]